VLLLTACNALDPNTSTIGWVLFTALTVAAALCANSLLRQRLVYSCVPWALDVDMGALLHAASCLGCRRRGSPNGSYECPEGWQVPARLQSTCAFFATTR
jgi:hypothetical protein